MEDRYIIAPATKEELPLLSEIARREGWNPIAYSYLMHAAVCPEGLYFGKLNGEIISTCLSLKFSDQFGYLNLYWVDPRYRGKTYGFPIYERAMQLVEHCDIVALDSVIEQIPKYEKWGFRVACSINERCVYPIPDVDAERSALIVSDREKIELPKVCSFDEKRFPAKRQAFIKASFEVGQPFVALDPNSRLVVGYAVVTPCEQGYAIAPLMALSSQLAEDLIKEIFSFYKKKQNSSDVRMIVFTFDEREDTTAFMIKHFPTLMFHAKRMYRRQQPEMDFDRSCIYSTSGYDRIG